MAPSSSPSDALLAEFSSKLDSSLILAIAAEIDPSAPSSEQSARETLSALAQAASEQGDAHEYEQEDYAYAGGSPPPAASASGSQLKHLLSPTPATGASGEASSARSSGIESEDGTAPASMTSSVASLATTASTTGTGATDTEAASYATDDEAVERAFREWTLAEEEDQREQATPPAPPTDGASSGSQQSGHSTNDVERPSQLRRTSSRPQPRLGGSAAQDTSTDDPITFLKNLFPKRERIEIQLALEDADVDVEVRDALFLPASSQHSVC